MKVVLVNGSRRDAGCTYTALSVVAKELEAQGIGAFIVLSKLRFPILNDITERLPLHICSLLELMIGLQT